MTLLGHERRSAKHRLLCQCVIVSPGVVHEAVGIHRAYEWRGSGLAARRRRAAGQQAADRCGAGRSCFGLEPVDRCFRGPNG